MCKQDTAQSPDSPRTRQRGLIEVMVRLTRLLGGEQVTKVSKGGIQIYYIKMVTYAFIVISVCFQSRSWGHQHSRQLSEDVPSDDTTLPFGLVASGDALH